MRSRSAAWGWGASVAGAPRRVGGGLPSGAVRSWQRFARNWREECSGGARRVQAALGGSSLLAAQADLDEAAARAFGEFLEYAVAEAADLHAVDGEAEFGRIRR